MHILDPDVSARSKHLDCRYYKIRRYIEDFKAFREILFDTARDVDVVAYAYLINMCLLRKLDY